MRHSAPNCTPSRLFTYLIKPTVFPQYTFHSMLLILFTFHSSHIVIFYLVFTLSTIQHNFIFILPFIHSRSKTAGEREEAGTSFTQEENWRRRLDNSSKTFISSLQVRTVLGTKRPCLWRALWKTPYVLKNIIRGNRENCTSLPAFLYCSARKHTYHCCSGLHLYLYTLVSPHYILHEAFNDFNHSATKILPAIQYVI